MNKKIIILISGLIVLLIVGILAWQFWPKQEVVVPESPIEKREQEVVVPEKIAPEEVVKHFLNCYIFTEPHIGEKCLPFETGKELGFIDLIKSPHVTERFKQTLIEIDKKEVWAVDPIIWAQDFPEKFIVGKATIIDNTASLIVTAEPWANYALKVDLLLVDNQWKINSIIPID